MESDSDSIEKVSPAENVQGDKAAREADLQLNRINKVFLSFILVGLAAAAIFAQNPPHIATAWLWSLASLAIGSFAGLLFGIPRSGAVAVQPGDKGASDGENKPSVQVQNSKYTPNNNLIEVSDWLTKII